LLKDLRDAVWQMKRDEVEQRKLFEHEKRKNEELTQLIIEVEKDRDELNEKLQETQVEMLQMGSNKTEGSTWGIVRWFLLVTVVVLFMSLYNKDS
jgi:predicted RNase H-like nuclease (RuvC/YqgF family)